VEVNYTHTAVEMAYKYTTEHGKEEITLLENFKCHMALFSDEEANKFPPTCGNGDHKIVLMDTAPTCFNCKAYPLLQDEQKAADQFIDKNLAKRYSTSHHWTPPMVSQHLWSLKRTQKRNNTLLTIAPSMQSLERTPPHSPTSNSPMKTYREWSYLANLISAGVITISKYKKETNGKLLSKPAKDYLNQK